MVKIKSEYFWESNLVCPSCRGEIQINKNTILCSKCNSRYSFINGIPCFCQTMLTAHQKSELNHIRASANNTNEKLYQIRIGNLAMTPASNLHKWCLNWINDKTVTKESRIICLGGCTDDDLPHISSDYKFNIDHLAHESISLVPEMAKSAALYN